MNSFFSKQSRNDYLAPDRIIAIIFLCIATVFIVWAISTRHYKIQLPFSLLVSSLIYTLFREKISRTVNTPEFAETNRIRLIVNIVFAISLSLIIWLSWSNLYYRPPLYFVLVLVAAASIIVDVFCLNERKSSHITIVLLKIIVLSLIIYAGIYYQFPGIYGDDPWLHNEWIKETINFGHITSGNIMNNSYYFFPVFHLVAALAKILTSLSIYNSIFISIGIVMAISSIFVFLIGEKIVNTKVGLLAALIVSLNCENIGRATAIIAMSLGYFWFLVILYLIFVRNERKISIGLLVILLSMVLILTHTIASLITLISLIGVFISIKLYKQSSRSITSYEAPSWNVIMLFIVAMLTMWMQKKPGSHSFLDITLGPLSNSLPEFAMTSAPIVTNIPYAFKLLDQGGYLIILFFAIIGILAYIHPKNYNREKIALIFLGGILLVPPNMFDFFRLNNILPARWLIFIYVPLSILAIAGLLRTSNLIQSKMGSFFLIMLVLLSILFSMDTNSVANNDSPLVFNNADRIGYTQSEITAIETLSNMNSGRPVTDIYYGEIFPYIISNDKYLDMVRSDNTIFIQRNYYLYNPDWNEKYRTRIHEGGPDNFRPELVQISDYMERYGITAQSLIYNNGNVKAYAIEGHEKDLI